VRRGFHDRMLSCFDTIPACDIRTDGYTETVNKRIRQLKQSDCVGPWTEGHAIRWPRHVLSPGELEWSHVD